MSTSQSTHQAKGNDIPIQSAPKLSKPTGRKVATSCHKCQSCNQQFRARKSLLRHVRTIHQTTTFSCTQCNNKFARKDIRDRHVFEGHSNMKRTVKCTICGRCVGKRALAEHLDSNICRHTRSNDVQNARLELGVKYVGPENDPFLAALRMLKFFERESNGATLQSFTNNSLSIFYPRPERLMFHPTAERSWPAVQRRPQTLPDEIALIRYENIAISLVREGLSKTRAPFRSLAIAALLLGAMAHDKTRILTDKACHHFTAAHRLFGLNHDSVCQCGQGPLCVRFSPFTAGCPEAALLDRLFKELGMANGIKDTIVSETGTHESFRKGYDTMWELLNDTTKAELLDNTMELRSIILLDTKVKSDMPFWIMNGIGSCDNVAMDPMNELPADRGC